MSERSIEDIARRLKVLVTEELARWVFPEDACLMQEPQFTGQFLYPRVDAFVRELGRKSLLVRGNGGTPPQALVLADMTFYPDLEVVEFNHRLLGFEVKFLRDTDPSGSLSKALGQAWLYQSLGFFFSHLVILDCRNNARSRWSQTHQLDFAVPPGLSMTLYSQGLDRKFSASLSKGLANGN